MSFTPADVPGLSLTTSISLASLSLIEDRLRVLHYLRVYQSDDDKIGTQPL